MVLLVSQLQLCQFQAVQEVPMGVLLPGKYKSISGKECQLGVGSPNAAAAKLEPLLEKKCSFVSCFTEQKRAAGKI